MSDNPQDCTWPVLSDNCLNPQTNIFHNYDPKSHYADLVLISCPSDLNPEQDLSAEAYSPALGMLYVASAASTKSAFGIVDEFRVKYIDGTKGFSFDEIIHHIAIAKPRLVGLNSIHQTTSVMGILASTINKVVSNTRIVVGGTNAMLRSDQILMKYPEVICCVGEGEKAIRSLLRGADPQYLDGISFFNGQVVVTNPPIPLRIDDDEDVEVLYGKFGGVYMDESGKKTAAMLTSRGCPWRCSFCSTPNSMGKPRYRKIDRITQDLLNLYTNHSVEIVHIYDDVFIVGTKRMASFVDAIERTRLAGKLSFKVLARADVVSRLPLLLLERLRQVGIERVAIGIESGNNNVLNSIQKGITTDMVVEALHKLKSTDVRTKGFFMFGVPNETVTEMRDTYEFAKFLRDNGLLDIGVAHFAKAYPGTEWEQAAIKLGKQLTLNNEYIPVAHPDGSLIRRNLSIPQLPLSDVDSELILDFVVKTNHLWA